jgi:hypothetical protein
MMCKDVILVLTDFIPKPTTVSTIMDEIYQAVMIALCSSTHMVYTRKIKANTKAIAGVSLGRWSTMELKRTEWRRAKRRKTRRTWSPSGFMERPI